MIETNFPAPKVTHYNQMNFNLDAPSPASTMTSSFTPPPFILVQKFPKKLTSSPKVRPPYLAKNIEMSDKMSLALQLAKLDVDNSIREERHLQNQLKSPETQKKTVTKKPVKVRMYPKPKLHGTKNKTDKGTSYEKNKSYYETFKSSNRRNAEFANSLRLNPRVNPPKSVQFVPPKRSYVRHKIPPGMKDAITSTNDLRSVADSFASDDELTYRRKPPSDLVKKEKLQKRFNQQTPSKSGFLSHYRSPPKRRNPNFAKQPAVIARCEDCSKSFVTLPEKPSELRNQIHSPRSPERVIKPSTIHSLMDRPNSPVISPRSLDRGKAKRNMQYCDFNPSVPRTLCHDEFHDMKRTPYPQTKSNRDKKYFPRRKPNRDFFTDSSFDDQIQVAAVHPELANDDTDLVNTMRNDPQCETLYQRLADIENEEKAIRHRWREIKYDDMKHHDVSSPKRDYDLDSDLLMNRKSATENPELINIHGGKNFKSPPKKEVVRFVPKRSSKLPLTEKSVQFQPDAFRRKITLPEEIIDSIFKNKAEFRRHLNSVFHEPKGKFNPWKIVTDLSEEIVNNVIGTVCEEVNDGFDGCVEQLFEAEFAEPNQSSLQSTADQSSRFSAFLHNDSSFAHKTPR